MQNVMLIGIDPGKHAFHIHAQDKNDNQHYAYLTEQIEEPKQKFKNHMADDDTAQRLLTIPGAGLITASFLATKLGESAGIKICDVFWCNALALLCNDLNTIRGGWLGEDPALAALLERSGLRAGPAT